MAVPTAVVAVLAIALLGPPLGNALLAPEPVRFWAVFQGQVYPEPVEQARFLLALAAPLLLAALTAVGVRRGPRAWPWAIDVLTIAIQAAAIGFAVVCLLAQNEALGPLYPPGEPAPLGYRYFHDNTLVVAAAGTAVLVWAARAARPRAWLTRLTRETRGRAIVAGGLAVAAIAVWLLHAFYTEGTIAGAYVDVLEHIQFPLNETFAVIDGRSPLVNFAAQYGSLWPYAFAAGMALLGDELGVWVALALLATGLGMLAIYGVLRRAAHSSVRGLLLFLPVLATSFFMLRGTLDDRYTFANYFGTFPIRYAGPSILAWLVARHLGGAQPRPAWPLFVCAGLVVLNNADVGAAAFGATVAALLWSGGRPTRASVGRLAAAATSGLLVAFALVSLLTLARAGALPDLGLLLRFSRLFASAGFAMFAMPTIGLHLAVYLTFVAALGVATVRALDHEPDRLLTGMLAWASVFGLGAGAYFAGRSTPANLIATFFPWSFAVALLLIPALRSIAGASLRRPPLAAGACVFAFLAMACSLAQTPTPWDQIDRLQRAFDPVLTQPADTRFVAQQTRRDERVAILEVLGHRIAAKAGATNVSPYSGLLSMPTREQLDETIRVLRAEGGRKLFTSVNIPDELQLGLRDAGFEFVMENARRTMWLWLDDAAR